MSFGDYSMCICHTCGCLVHLKKSHYTAELNKMDSLCSGHAQRGYGEKDCWSELHVGETCPDNDRLWAAVISLLLLQVNCKTIYKPRGIEEGGGKVRTLTLHCLRAAQILTLELLGYYTMERGKGN